MLGTVYPTGIGVASPVHGSGYYLGGQCTRLTGRRRASTTPSRNVGPEGAHGDLRRSSATACALFAAAC